MQIAAYTCEQCGLPYSWLAACCKQAIQLIGFVLCFPQGPGKKGFLCITCLERKDLGGGQRKNTFVSTSFRYNFNSFWLQNSAGIQLSPRVP